MKHLKLYQEHKSYKVIKAIENHLDGYSLDDYDIKLINNYFDGKIPFWLKYSGELYRFIFVKTKKELNDILKNGLKCIDNKKYASWTKSLDNKDKFLEDIGHNNNYYIIFKKEISEKDVFFDMNEMCDELGINNHYDYEEEVLVRCLDLKPSEIIEYDEY